MMTEKQEIIIDIIDKISDLNFQKDVWVDQTYWDRILNYGEAVNTLGDYNFYDDVDNGKIKFKEENKNAILKAFLKRLLDYNEPYKEDTLKDEEWLKISKQAAIIKSMLLDEIFS